MLQLFNRQKKDPELELTIATRTVVRILFLILGFIILFAALRRASHALVLIGTAVFLTLALNSPVHGLSRRLPGKLKGNRTTATAVSFLLVVAILGIFIASILPPLVNQSKEFIAAAPGLVRSIRDENSTLGQFIHHYHLESQVNNFSSQLSDRLNNASGTAVGAITKLGSSVFSVLTILVLTFMMLIEGPRWLNFIQEILPKNRQAYAKRVMPDMYRVIKGYVNGQVTLALLASALILPALLVLHISYPVALVLIIFICGLIPMVGHTIGAVIVTIVALFHSPVSAIIILAYYILYQQIENYVIQPRIQANSTDMSPLLVFTSVILGVSFGGLLGGLVAIPVMGCIRIVVLDYLHAKDIIPERIEGPTDDTK